MHPWNEDAEENQPRLRFVQQDTPLGNDKPIPPALKDRAAALAAARILWGDMATISSDETLPRMAWEIGNFEKRIERNTWSEIEALCLAKQWELFGTHGWEYED